MVTQEKTLYCIRCGKQIDADSEFCTHCGASQRVDKSERVDTPVKETHTDKLVSLSPNQKVGLTLTGIWCLIHLAMLFASPLEEGDVDESIWFVDTDFSDFYAYGKGEFIFYAILIPAIVWGAAYIYKISKKVALSILAFLVFCSGAYWIKVKYDKYSEEKKLEQLKIEEEAAANAPIINRVFCDCNFGDSYSEVYKVVKSKYGNCINDSLSDSSSIVLGRVNYGNYFYDRLRFDFYNGQLYQVYFRKSYDTKSNRDNGYRNFKDLFEGKSYPHDAVKYEKYSNNYFYSDKHTELSLRYSVPEYDGDDYFVQLIYYDKDSGQREKGL